MSRPGGSRAATVLPPGEPKRDGYAEPAKGRHPDRLQSQRSAQTTLRQRFSFSMRFPLSVTSGWLWRSHENLGTFAHFTPKTGYCLRQSHAAVLDNAFQCVGVLQHLLIQPLCFINLPVPETRR